jgi:hypothetical protein
VAPWFFNPTFVRNHRHKWVHDEQGVSIRVARNTAQAYSLRGHQGGARCPDVGAVSSLPKLRGSQCRRALALSQTIVEQLTRLPVAKLRPQLSKSRIPGKVPPPYVARWSHSNFFVHAHLRVREPMAGGTFWTAGRPNRSNRAPSRATTKEGRA